MPYPKKTIFSLSGFNAIKMFVESTVTTVFFSLAGGTVVMPAVISLFYKKQIRG
ncbi:putative RND superfamily exporter protein [Methanomicrobium sp. W14]|jgi:predicted RND superfamily exporter protein|uniref:hypothetical protein n=1 Tax=Methanomicrobium sp. W14 TaxID=2817839 RepID=UPI001AE90972|nr:hypothetical protein [Methanomicrobium sp. W14]MBP2132165.1 putative RND superfamily exporter protein [Methanomicrobium sp. W14]